MLDGSQSPGTGPEAKLAEDGVEVSVVMPCLNEAETVGECVRKARRSLEERSLPGEVIVADNGSTDGSRELAREAGARVVRVGTRGYGAALAGGIAAARGELVIMGDADDSYDFLALLPFVEKLREGYDLVVGNRLKGGIEVGAMPPLHRYLGNPVLTHIARLFFKSPVGDINCGFRAFRRAAYDRMRLQTTGMEFASEMVVKATLLGMAITEIPTTLSPDGRSRPPHIRSWRDGWRHLRFMLLFSPRWLFLYPGVLLIALGSAGGYWLHGGPRQIGDITLDVHTMLYAAGMVLVGFQAVLFAVFSKVFAITEGLLPEDPWLKRAFRYVSLETGLLVGGGLLVAGVLGSLRAVLIWQATSFGDLVPSDVLRVVIPSVLAIALGCQVILGSFFLSVLGLSRR